MTLIAYSLSTLAMIVLPVALVVGLRRRRRVPWWLFCVGMATFVGAQLAHLPLNNWLSDLGILRQAPGLQGRALVQTALILGATAGLSETLARVVGYWLLFRADQARHWEDGVMVGLGHGGIEAMLFGAVLTAASVSSLWAIRGTDLATLELSQEQLAALTQQLSLFLETPWQAALAPIERAIAMVLHVTLSVLVWFAFKRRKPLFIVAALFYHALVDGVAVYLAYRLGAENYWLLELVFLGLTVPGLSWALYLRRKSTRASQFEPVAIRAELRLFVVALRKELLQQWRTRRVLVVGAVFAVFGLLSPLIAYFTPELLRTMEGAEQFAEAIPTPTTAEALNQYIRNLTQFGFIIAILLGMGAIAGEKEKGTTAMVLSKPMSRWGFVVSKFVAQALVFLTGFIVAAVGAYYYTLILFEPLAWPAFLLGNVLLLVWLLAFVAVTLLGSAVGRSTGAAAGMAFGGSVLLLLAGNLPRIGALAPAALVSWAGQLGLGDGAAPNAGALAATVVLIVVCLILSVAVFEVQEL